jgi:hypothetical protein
MFDMFDVFEGEAVAVSDTIVPLGSAPGRLTLIEVKCLPAWAAIIRAPSRTGASP